MKKVMLLFVAMIATTMLFAQDIIVTTDSKKIEAKIVEVSSTQVKYLDFNVQDGPTFVLSTDEISSIIFASGQVKVYEHDTPKSVVVQPEVKNEYILRQGNKYFYDGRMMRNLEYAEFLKNNCTAAYNKYRHGYIVSLSGWATFILARGLNVAYSVSGNPYIWFPAVACDIAGITALIVGYTQMHRSADLFNSACVGKSQAYWSVTASQNGVGLALNF
jgi:hypothetical protein